MAITYRNISDSILIEKLKGIERRQLKDGNQVFFKLNDSYGDGSHTKINFAELLVSMLGEAVDVDCQKVELAKRDRTEGCICYDFLKENERFINGYDLIKKSFFDNLKDLRKLQKHQKIYHRDFDNIPLLLNNLPIALKKHGIPQKYFESIETGLLKMIVSDCLTANTDRHIKNWGIIVNDKSKAARFAPLFDNQMAFGFYSSEKKINSLLDNAKKFDTFSREALESVMFVHDSAAGSQYTSIIDYLASHNPKARKIIGDIAGKLSDDKLKIILGNFNEKELPKPYKRLACVILGTRRNYMLKSLKRPNTSYPSIKPSNIRDMNNPIKGEPSKPQR